MVLSTPVRRQRPDHRPTEPVLDAEPDVRARGALTDRVGEAVRAPRWSWEVGLLLSLYAVYDGTRGLVRGDGAAAERNGRAILAWEQRWHLSPEHWLNNAMSHSTLACVAAAYFYATLHFVVTPGVLIWMHRSHPGSYRKARTTLVLGTLIGLLGYWLSPTAPPRLLVGDHFHDVLAQVHQWGWWGSEGSAPRGLGSLTDQLAAMPSLHVGWALWCGWLLYRHAPRRMIRIAGLGYPVLTTIVVLGTGNHYLLDALGGVGVIGLAGGVVWLGERLLDRRTNSLRISMILSKTSE